MYFEVSLKVVKLLQCMMKKQQQVQQKKVIHLGGLRNTTSTETQKDVIYSEESGNKVPMTEKVIMPTIEGAVVTAEGAKNANVKTNIVNAIKSATGLSIDRIQVFEMNE